MDMKTKSVNFKHKMIVITAIILFAAPPVSAQLSSQGPDNPSTVAEQAAGCLSCPGADWMNPGNAMLPDSNYTQTQMMSFPSCFQTSCYYTRALLSSNFGFTVPGNTVITGIRAEVLRKAASVNAILDSSVRLLPAGFPAGNNHASASTWPIPAAYQTYGDSADSWGLTLTPADVNATGFGLYFKAMNQAPSASTIAAYIDHVRMTVYYQAATGFTEHQSSDDAFIVYDDAADHVIVIRTYRLHEPAVVSVFNETGQLVCKKIIGNNDYGRSVSAISRENFSNGIYFVECRSGAITFRKKVMILK